MLIYIRLTGRQAFGINPNGETMQLIDLETKEKADIKDVVKEIKAQLRGNTEGQTRFGIETKLDCYYRAALKVHSESLEFNIAQVSFMPGLGKRLLYELQDRIFPYVHEMSTDAHILREVLRALTKIIPGGYVNKRFVRDFMGFLMVNGSSRYK